MKKPRYNNPDRKARYEVVAATSDVLTIRDIGPWDQYMTVTNAIEEVVQELIDKGIAHDGQRLTYYDSDGNHDEIIWDNATFRGFRPARV